MNEGIMTGVNVERRLLRWKLLFYIWNFHLMIRWRSRDPSRFDRVISMLRSVSAFHELSTSLLGRRNFQMQRTYS